MTNAEKTVDTRRKLHEALWKQTVSRTHRLWCDCGQFLSHFKGWQGSTDEENGGDGGHKDAVDFGAGVGERENEAIDAALRYENDEEISELNLM